MFSLRTHAVIFFAIFAAIVALAVAGNVAQSYGVPRPPPPFLLLLQIVFLSFNFKKSFLAYAATVVVVLVTIVFSSVVS